MAVGLASKGEIQALAGLTTTCYVSLHTSAPDDTGAPEISGGGYARAGAVTFVNSGANPTVAQNSVAVSFPQASGSWGTITHFGLWDASSGGNFRGYNIVNTSKAVNANDTARFAINALTITVG